MESQLRDEPEGAVKPVYASRRSMWLVVADVLQRQWTHLMPDDGGGRVDVDAVVAAVDRVYEEGGDDSVLDGLIRESLDQMIEKKMIPDRGDPWLTKS